MILKIQKVSGVSIIIIEVIISWPEHCKIMKHHQSPKKLSQTSIIPLNNKWNVRSLNMADTHYVIEKLLESCDCKIMNHNITVKCVHMLTHVHV